MVEASCTKSDAPGVIEMVLYGRLNTTEASRHCWAISHHVGDSAYPIFCIQLAERGSQIHFNTVGRG